MARLIAAKQTPRRTAKQGSRSLRKGRYQLAAARLDRSLRADPDGNEARSLLRRFFGRARSADPGTAKPTVEALLDYRVAGVHLIQLALESGAVDEGIQWSRWFLERFPDDPAVLTLLSYALESKNDYDEAIAVCDRLLHSDPENVQFLQRRASVRVAKANESDEVGEAEEQEYRRALEDYDALIALAADSCSAFLERGRVRGRLGDEEAALSDFDAALRCDPGLANAYYERAAINEARGNAESALRDYEEVKRRWPNLPTGYFLHGHLLASMGRWSEAEADLTHALRIDPTLAQAYQERAVARRASGDLESARADCDKVVSIWPDDAGAYLSRAYTYMQLGEADLSAKLYERSWADYERALDDAEHAVRLAPGEPANHVGRGLALRALDGYDWAVEAFDTAVERARGDDLEFRAVVLAERAEALRVWGQFLRDSDALERAIKDYREALALSGDGSDLAWVFGGLATALIGQRALEEAGAAFDEALRRDERNIWAWIGRGKLLMLQADHSGAAREFARAVAINEAAGSDVGWPSVGWGLALEKMGRPEEATKMFARAFPNSSDARLRIERGALFEDFDEYDHAEEEYRAAIAADPKLGDGYNSLAWLLADKIATSSGVEEAASLARQAVELIPGGPAAGFALHTLGWVQHLLGRDEEAVGTLRKAHALAPYRMIRRLHLDAATRAAQQA